ncbi:MAG: YfiR family protein [Methylobacter sp.]
MEFLKFPRRIMTRFKLRAYLWIFIFIALASGAVTPAHAEVEEYALKAAFLYKFGLFIEWPGTAASSSSSPLNLCISGDDPFGEAIDKVVAGGHINSRNAIVHRLKEVKPDSGCHILYIGGSDADYKTRVIKYLFVAAMCSL